MDKTAPPACAPGLRSSDHLNLIRGLAAVAVLIYHVRYRLFLDYSDLVNPDLLARGFYAVTAFGHDAVMVFFVLSGYFISSSVQRDHELGRWSWRRYAVNRGTRLYVVLLPALLMTVFWDELGLLWHGSNAVYSGAPQAWKHDFFSVADRINPATILSNALFLQTIATPPLGSNEPLWSLSYEFWYYVLFPCLWLATRRKVAWGSRITCMVLCAAVFFGVGKAITLYFPIWLLGTLVASLPQIPALRCRHPAAVTALACLAFVALVAGSHLPAWRAALGGTTVLVDYANGILFALLLYLMLHNQRSGDSGRLARFSSWLAGFSFTLYVVHTPILVFLRAWLVPDEPWQPRPGQIATSVILSVLILGYAYALSQLTEARTNRVRDKVLSLTGKLAR